MRERQWFCQNNLTWIYLDSLDQAKKIHFSDKLGCDMKLQNSMLKMDSS